MRKNNYDKGFQEVARQLDYLKARCQNLEDTLAKMGGIKFPKNPLLGFKAMNFGYDKKDAIKQLPEDFKKIKELTKVDDYEYQTTPESKKLIKKVRKQAKDI